MEIKNHRLFGVFAYGDFGTPYLLGLGIDYDDAYNKILLKECKKWGYKLKDLGKGKFRKASRSEEDTETDYYIRKIPINVLL